MTQTVQISGKSNSGIIFAVGGNDVDEFLINLQAAHGGSRGDAIEILENAVKLITPVSMGGATGAPQNDYRGNNNSNQNDSRGGNNAGPPPGQNQPNCPNHNVPAKWVEGGYSQRTQKNYTGFWSCNMGDKSCKIRD